MKISLWINEATHSYETQAEKPLRDLLWEHGFTAVRDSDDYEGFCGSDTVLMDGVPVYSDLIPAALADGTRIVTRMDCGIWRCLAQAAQMFPHPFSGTVRRIRDRRKLFGQR
jgi:putative selenate reductase molybdopterin-binding subunit